MRTLAKLKTFSLLGIEALPVEVDVSAGARPTTLLVGLPEAAVKESTHRVERAIVNSGVQRPYDRVVINFAPAELPKQPASFDLPSTLGMLVGSGSRCHRQAPPEMLVSRDLHVLPLPAAADSLKVHTPMAFEQACHEQQDGPAMVA